jgi:DNA repair exonuclease SbcCD ATPase subunit|tara:strand:- start:617 stop:2341 length:1725 start_codon:yes stop_codon:yes gene_type:complete
MIIFKKLRYKNFLSTGNSFTEIDLQDSSTTLVVGQNGAGKSTMLDALSFGLFGKAHRKISKPQLVNTINSKATMVEVEFSIGSKDYKIVRGIKPNVFEIYVNGVMIDQSSHAKEYQQILEKNILKLNHKSFHQIVVLGSGSFVPFMQLSQAQRRDVIEDLLDINVFSKMNQLLKEKIALLKNSIGDNNHRLDVVNTKINSQKKYIRDLTAITVANRKQKESDIADLHKKIKKLSKQNIELSSKVEELLPAHTNEMKTLNEKKNKLSSYNTQFKTQVKGIVKEAKFFEDNESCPTCEQVISDDLRKEKKDKAQFRAKELNDAMIKVAEEIVSVNSEIERVNSELILIQKDQTEMYSNNKSISQFQNQIDRIQSEIDSLVDSEGDMGQANKDLDDLRDQLHSFQDEKYKLNEQHSYNQVSSELLKDTGIKTKIIKQYIPVINQLTNQYLQTLDFFVHFDLDESFQETIRSRHRDSFTYDSFSEGEKQRIDLSLLFTWRQVAKMKNSVATNLLILDETFDSSLDEDGVDNLMKIIHSLGDDTNVFVISHKSELEDAHFENKLVFSKKKNFSTLKKVA